MAGYIFVVSRINCWSSSQQKNIAMKFFKLIAIAACLVLGILACNNHSAEDQSMKEKGKTSITSFEQRKPALLPNQEEEPEQISDNYQSDTIQSPGQTQKSPASSKNNPASKIDWDKKIIKNASLNLEVKEFKVFNTAVREKTKQFGGYIAMEEQSQSEYKVESIMTIKVPVDQFDNAVTQFTNDAKKFIEKKITSEDVTAEVVDTKSRMEAKKQVRLRYLDLLKQAKNMEEILNVQQEINGIQEQIESAAGRIEYLSNSAVYSTIHLTYFQVLDPSAKDNDQPSFGTKFYQSFRNGLSWMGEVFIGLTSIWPLFLFGFICWIAYKRNHRTKITKA